MTAITQFTDIHTRTTTDMLHIVEVDNVLVTVVHGGCIQLYLLVYLCHSFSKTAAKVLIFFDIHKLLCIFLFLTHIELAAADELTQDGGTRYIRGFKGFEETEVIK